MPLPPETLAEILAAHRAGRPPAETVAAAYDRLEAWDDPAILIALLPRAEALARAAALTDPHAPLYGVPFMVKDNIDVAGLPTTAACKAFAYQPQADATVVARLVAAGAIPIGKTNLDQFATGLIGVRADDGGPRNAVDPALVPGGSSSGSAVAVAAGIVPFALGTDTAGSGRVPAALNRIVGLKPTVGAWSTTGVVPACRTLDCVTVFALTAEDAALVHSIAAGFDPTDPYSRAFPVGALSAAPPRLRVGVPMGDILADEGSRAAFAATIALLEASGAEIVPFDYAPFAEVASLVYFGPWVAERTAVAGELLARDPEAILPVTRGIIANGLKIDAVETFRGLYKLEALKRTTLPLFDKIDMLMVPTIPAPVTRAEVEADPLGPNYRLGTFTNFVNLLGLAALAIPGPDRPDGRPSGVTLVGRPGADLTLAGFGRVLHHAAGVPLGATGKPCPAPAAQPARAPAGEIELAVVGAHLSGMALNRELAALGARFLRASETTADYRLFALPGGPPERPGLLRVEPGTGGTVAVEVWSLTPEAFGRFVAGIPAPLGIGTLRLADGTTPNGFLCEAEAVKGATDITRFGGWRAYIAARAA